MKKFFTGLASLVGFLTAINSDIFTKENVFAQITPDNTLKTESSIVKPHVKIRGLTADSIEGGAIRGVNLFHSFLQFNVREGQRVYFANPAKVENILSRVTGNNPSHILGTLGILGNANLFLINPHGIIFGQNAQLDIRGSFVASTADRLTFPNGSKFSATNPQAPPVLTINVPIGLQYGTQRSAAIVNAGELKVGKDLTLSGNTVISTGLLSAPAGKLTVEGISGDVRVRDITAQTATLLAQGNLILENSLLQTKGNLNLLAQDTIRIRDSQTNPFIAIAGGQLLIQGVRHVDIFALNHPNSGLFSYSDMVLRSTNTVGGDAHYWSSGNFRIEKLDRSLGDLYSPYDPIIRARGDVSFSNYTGASLHILAGGSVNLDNVTITGTETGKVDVDFLREDIRLSDGTEIKIDGKNQATLDIRAGMSPDAVGSPSITGVNSQDCFCDNSFPLPFFNGTSETPTLTNSPTSARIAINSITISQPNGLVLLTNQYKPNNKEISQEISVGSINTSNNFFGLPLLNNGVSVYIDSRGDLNLFNKINADGELSDSGFGGEIVLLSEANVDVRGSLSSVSDGQEKSSKGGDIRIAANSIFLGENAEIRTTTLGRGDSGNVIIIARNDVNLGSQSKITSQVEQGAIGNAGNIEITTGSLKVTGSNTSNETDTAIVSRSRGKGNAGNITINADNTISLENGVSLNSGLDNTGIGKGGNITIATDSLSLKNASLFADTLGQGNSGNITINAGESVFLDKSNVFTSIGNIDEGIAIAGNGQGGDINITTPELSLNNNAQINASNIAGKGDGGNLFLDVRSLSLDNAQISASTSGQGNAGKIGIQADSVAFNNNSQVSTSVNEGAIGNGDDINLNARSLSLDNGAQISASTAGKGNAGSITIENANQVDLTNNSSISTSVEAGADGRGGEINLNARSLSLDNAQITASTAGRGNAGSIAVNGSTFEAKNGGQLRTSTASGNDAGSITLNLLDNVTLTGNNSGLFANTEQNSGGKGGNISAISSNMTISDGASVTVDSQGTGDGGNINVQTDSLTLDRGKISATTDSTEGGNIILNANDLLLLRNGSQITAQAGQTGNGGDITIDAGTIFAIPQQDNDIIANASEGDGGDIEITTQSLFNIEEREAIPGNRTNDIDASSEFGVDGTVTIDSPNVDPSRRSVPLANLTITPEVLQGCRAATQQGASRFISTGRGGLPPGIDEIGDRTVWEDLRSPTLSAENPSESETVESSNSSEPTQIIEAQGLLVGSDGKIVLTAQATTVTPTQIGNSSVGCRISQ
ncbi:MAG: filamentous hemagglutinin N-terminal domain-containing protein [Hydrococcus sp. Prado102]|jgi:filamentous hemagglutinin family protein|nr:filamentous hemagglutinin N-terminal domain-containing protein [Hydrococcus sp. Prado102]